MCKTWPFMDNLLGPYYGVPEALQQVLRQRYDEHAEEYATDEMIQIGTDLPYVPVNACFQKDTFQDIGEELVDTVFNTLVLCWKLRQNLMAQPLAEKFLMDLLEVWDKFHILRTEVAT